MIYWCKSTNIDKDPCLWTPQISIVSPLMYSTPENRSCLPLGTRTNIDGASPNVFPSPSSSYPLPPVHLVCASLRHPPSVTSSASSLTRPMKARSSLWYRQKNIQISGHETPINMLEQPDQPHMQNKYTTVGQTGSRSNYV